MAGARRKRKPLPKRRSPHILGGAISDGPRHERRQLAKAIEKAILAHPCDGCTACCTVKQIAELNKPEHTKCEHVKDSVDMHPPARGGCTIYKDRPQSCLDYFCAWRYGILGDDRKFRPDRIGLVFDIAEAPPPGVLMVSVREVTPGKVEENMGLLNELVAARGYVLYLMRGDKRHFMGPEEKVRACHEWSRRHLPLVAR